MLVRVDVDALAVLAVPHLRTQTASGTALR